MTLYLNEYLILIWFNKKNYLIVDRTGDAIEDPPFDHGLVTNNAIDGTNTGNISLTTDAILEQPVV